MNHQHSYSSPQSFQDLDSYSNFLYDENHQRFLRFDHLYMRYPLTLILHFHEEEHLFPSAFA